MLFAIFFIFSSIGFVSDIFNEFKLTYEILLLNILFSGSLGVIYVHTFIKNKNLLVFSILYQFLGTYIISIIGSNQNFSEIPENKFIIIGIALLVCIMLAYLFMIIFIVGEGVPQIKLRTEMELAREMHDVLVPEIKIENINFEIYGKSIPFSEVGGDLIDIYSDNEKVLCYLADVTGHGVSSGLFMGMFKSAMHTSLLKNNSLVSAFNDSNKALSKLKKQNIFLTAAGILFKENYNAEYSVAGHLPILNFSVSLNKVVKLLNKQIPISVKTDFEFKSDIIEYNSGDIFLILSDGLTEVFNKKNEIFGIEKIIRLLEINHAKSVEDLYIIINENVKNFGKQLDDQSLLIIKCK